MKFAQIPANTFQRLQMEAGIFCKTFNPATGAFSGLMGATTGGGSFSTSPEFSDFGEDIDNCPNDTKELKRKDRETCVMSTTFVTIDPATAKLAMGGADIDSNDATHIIPRRDLNQSDFEDVWWIGDYSDINTGDGAGFCAIHLMNALSTGGFQIQSGKNAKGNFALELTGHYTIENQSLVPYEVYIKAGESGSETPEIMLDMHSATIQVGDTLTLGVSRKVPSSATITWTSGTTSKATVTNGEVTGVAAGSSIITASITVDGATYTDTCTVNVVAGA